MVLMRLRNGLPRVRNLRAASIVVSSLSLAATMTAVVVFSVGPALADMAILKYDKHGRVISTDNMEARRGGSGTAPTAGQGSDKRAAVARRSLGKPVEMKTAPNPND
ncbi:MAG: hypothetical protein QF654_06720, partial [Alphaproteobacteria bacterium]|nr:hypothetical protein [Alphaproteobacteria bacterium]